MEYPELIKEVKKWGDSMIIRLNPDEISLYGIKLGDKIKIKIIEVSDGDGD